MIKTDKITAYYDENKKEYVIKKTEPDNIKLFKEVFSEGLYNLLQKYGKAP